MFELFECLKSFEQAWDTSAYRNRVGQIRIVDAGSTYWAHINVDHIRFSWDTQVTVGFENVYANLDKCIHR